MLETSFDEPSRTLTCRFSGEIKSANCSELAAALDGKIASLPRGDLSIVFDLENVSFVSSVFLRLVLMTAKRVKPGGLSISKANRFTRDLFRFSGLEQLLKDATGGIEIVDRESREFPPPPEFAARSRVGDKARYESMLKRSLEDPEGFWAEQARERLVWDGPWTRTLDWNPPHARWFDGGRLNACVNCLDRHLGTPAANKAAIIWEGEPEEGVHPGESRVLTYRQLHRDVCRLANVLKRHGVAPGDRVLIYLPMVPEAAAAMLACARLGAVHSVVFAGFSPQAVADRAFDCGAKMVLTADGSYRRGALVQLKRNVDEAFKIRDEAGRPLCASVEKVLVLRRAGNDVRMAPGRDFWWHEEVSESPALCPPVSAASEDPLFILYTSGSTGKPKGIVHSTAGYLLGAALSHRFVFDARDEDVFWCTADVGWITGHSYVVYGPLANGATVLMYEGAPDYPEPDRFWRIVEKHGVTVFYTSPTAIRSFMQWGDEWPKGRDLSSLRLLGSVGEPINPNAWLWYHEVIGGGRCPIVDTWWQTETGSIMITTLPGALAAKPGSAGRPFFGVRAEVVDEQGRAAPAEAGGRLVLREPWPSMLRGVWGDPERYRWTYWNDVPGAYSTGDGARTDRDGYTWIVGRLDDVLNVSGHRLGTAEIESALVSHPAVAEAAAVGRPDDVKGSALVVFVTLKKGRSPGPELRDELRAHVGRKVGATAKPDEVRFAEALPKTRSGKIMRRVLKQVAAGTEIKGDFTTIEDFGVLERLSGEG